MGHEFAMKNTLKTQGGTSHLCLSLLSLFVAVDWVMLLAAADWLCVPKNHSQHSEGTSIELKNE